MRMLLGAVSLLIALVVVSTLAKKQVTAGVPARAGSSPQAGTPQLQTQVKDAVDAALLQRRPEPDDK